VRPLIDTQILLGADQRPRMIAPALHAAMYDGNSDPFAIWRGWSSARRTGG